MSQSPESKLISERGLDYRTLQGLLKSKNWEKADIETSKQMLQANRSKSKLATHDQTAKNHSFFTINCCLYCLT
jgi:hypothetical protein